MAHCSTRRWHVETGSFGSVFSDGIDSGLSVFGEVLEAFDWPEAEASKECQRGVAQGGERLRGMSGMGACLILAAGHVADVMQAVLDAPMRARQGEQLCRSGPISRQAGDGVDRLGAWRAAQDALSADAADLCQAWPGRRQMRGQRGGGLQSSCLDPAMVFADRLGVPEVRRWRPCRTGGKPARRPGRCRLSVPVGCS